MSPKVPSIQADSSRIITAVILSGDPLEIRAAANISINTAVQQERF